MGEVEQCLRDGRGGDGGDDDSDEDDAGVDDRLTAMRSPSEVLAWVSAWRVPAGLAGEGMD